MVRSVPVNAGACRPSSGLCDRGGLLGRPGGQDDADHDQHEQDGAGHPAGDVAVGAGSCRARGAPRHERAHRLGRARPARAARLSASARPVTRSDGADAGSVGRRRDPGTRASRPPSPISRPPAHSQATSGSMTTPMATDPCGQVVDGLVARRGARARRRRRRSGRRRRRGPSRWPACRPPTARCRSWSSPERTRAPSTLTSASCDVRDGEVTVRSPSNSKRCPS